MRLARERIPCLRHPQEAWMPAHDLYTAVPEHDGRRVPMAGAARLSAAEEAAMATEVADLMADAAAG